MVKWIKAGVVLAAASRLLQGLPFLLAFAETEGLSGAAGTFCGWPFLEH
jgi:hypothetical protein